MKSREWADQAAVISCRRGRRHEDASLAPGSGATLRALQDPAKRPPVPREPLADHLFQREGAWFDLDHDRFAKNLRVAKRGAAGGPSGMTSDHLRPLLESVEDTTRFWRLAQDLSRAVVPDEIVDVVRLGRLTALQKPSGGVRGIVAGDIIRRLVARTISQQWATAVERATAPFQYALTTKSGAECIAHELQTLTDLDDRATVLSIDGIGAFDLISRGSMLEGLRSVDGGSSALPFVLQFYGNPSSYLWTADNGVTHGIWQGEGGDQGDPLMPMLYALGQHQALRSVQSHLGAGESLFAFHDDIYTVSQPERVGDIHNLLRDELWHHSRIQIHAGKTQIWNRGGFEPLGHAALLEVARMADPEAKLWFGDLEDRPEERGIRVLGTPLGSDEFVRVQLQLTVDSHRLLLDRIPAVQDLQSAWLLLLFCAVSRATYYLRVCRPSVTDLFARQHDAQIWQCLVALLGHDPPNPVWEVGSLPLHLGGLGLRSAVRTAPAARWGSWADCLHTISERHAHIARTMTDALISPSAGAVHLTGVVRSRASLADSGFVCPEWTALVEGLRPNQPGRDEVDPADHTHVWQFFAAQRVEYHFRAETVWPRLAPTEQALLRSQSGPMSGVPFSAVPSSPPTRFAPQIFRVLLLRRLWLSFPLTSRTCRCGRPLDPRGHHRAACPRAGVLGSRGFSVESAAARVCREAGARVSTNLFVRDLDLPVAPHDARRLEVVADGLPLFGGPSWPSTPLLCPRCVQMGNPAVSAPVRTGQPWQKLTV